MTKNQIDYWSLQETKRANAAREALTKQSNEEVVRHNLAGEYETNRTNTQNELIRSKANQLGYAQLAETERANRAREQQNLLQITETGRSNRAKESLASEQNQINKANVAESARSHRASEDIQRAGLFVDNFTKLLTTGISAGARVR